MTGIERIENLLDGAIPTLSSLPVQIFVEENFLPMTDIETTITALRFALIPRLL